MPTVRLSENNSITIPDEILRKLGFKPGDSLAVDEVSGDLVVCPVRPVAAPPVKLPPVDGKSLKEAISRKNLETGIQLIKGIGPKLAALLEKKEIRTVEDALYLLPLRYEDSRKLIPISSLTPGQTALF